MSPSSPVEESFHKKRRMFAFVDGAVMVAPPDSVMDHRAWFIQEGWVRDSQDSAFDDIIRGYTDGVDVYAYRGTDFRGDAFVIDFLASHHAALTMMLALPLDVRFFAGVIPGEVGAQWAPYFRVNI